MIGTIIGDIAGSNYEFDNTSDYNFKMFGEDSNFTDDTICTIAMADAILNSVDYQTSMRRWCRKYPHPKGEYGSYFLNWVLRPILIHTIALAMAQRCESRLLHSSLTRKNK